jgi:hypothetical protein
LQYGRLDPVRRFRNHGIYAPIKAREPDENLTGWVMGKEASDYEERIFRAASGDSRVRRIMFRRIFGAPSRSMAGAAELDFLFLAGSPLAVQIDAERFHLGAQMWQRDLNKDRIIMRVLKYQGISVVHRIRGKQHLSTQEAAERTWEQLLAGRVFTKWS